MRFLSYLSHGTYSKASIKLKLKENISFPYPLNKHGAKIIFYNAFTGQRWNSTGQPIEPSGDRAEEEAEILWALSPVPETHISSAFSPQEQTKLKPFWTMTIYKIYRMTVEVKSCQNLVGKGRHPNPTTPHLHHPQHTAESTRDSPPISVNTLAQAKRKGRRTKTNQEKCRRGTKGSCWCTWAVGTQQTAVVAVEGCVVCSFTEQRQPRILLHQFCLLSGLDIY